MGSINVRIALSLFALLTLAASSASGNGIYTLIAPNKIYPNSTYTILITGNPLKTATLPPPFSAAIQCTPNPKFSNLTTIQIPIGDFRLQLRESKLIQVVTPETLVSENFNSCHLVLKNLNAGVELNRKVLQLTPRANDPAHSKLFLQMDKPAYKPGDTVRLRIIILDQHNLPNPSTENLRVTLMDPMGIKMNQWPNKNNPHKLRMDKNGLLKLQLSLSHELNLGQWKITVEANRNSLSKEFLVEKYVLPKFGLKFSMTPTPYVTSAKPSFTVVVSATYTYGKNLNGRLAVSMYNQDRPTTNFTQEAVLTNGKAAFQFHPDQNLGGRQLEKGMILNLLANVTEDKTGRFQTAIHKIPVLAVDPFKITWLNPVGLYKPGIPSVLKFAISDFENMPVSDMNPDCITLTSLDMSGKTESLKSIIPLSGIVTFLLTVPTTAVNFQHVLVKYKSVTLTLPVPRPFKPSVGVANYFFDISTDGRPEDCIRGENMKVTLKASHEILSRVNYLLWSGTEIVGFGTDLETNPNPDQLSKTGSINVHLPKSKAYAQLSLIVYFHHGPTGSLIAASTRLATNNYLEMNLGRATVDPGTNLTIPFQTHPGSTIAIRGVDTSLLLLSRDSALNDIDPGTVPYNPFYHTYHKAAGQSHPTLSNTLGEFRNLGLDFLTNGDFGIGGPRTKRAVGIYGELDDEIDEADRPVVSDHTYYEGSIRTRTNFPETWLWKEFEATDLTSIYRKGVPVVPDTITSWYVTALSLNRESGLAVTQSPSLLTVFRPFFITLHLPYSVLKGDIFELKALVHNYLGHKILARVTFYNDEENFRFIDSREHKEQNVTRTIEVNNEEVGVVSFVIQPLVRGNLPLSLRAICSVAGDAVIQSLRVDLPGVRMWESKTPMLFDGKTAMANDTIRIQRTRLRRDTEHKLTVSGSPMQARIPIPDAQQGVSSLIKLPTGCGEQSMMGFVPNILALDWLRAIQKHDPVTEAQIIKYLEVGYQMQMKYFNADGSFKYFFDGQANKRGSTWLTAFVLRCLSQAKNYIPVDSQRVLIKGLKFLLTQQNAVTGEFIENGAAIYYREIIQGGIATANPVKYSLTAYVTLTLIEIAQTISSELSAADKIELDAGKLKGLKFISSESSLMDSDPYSLILVTATLAAAAHPSRHDFFAKMEKQAWTTQDKKLKWWQLDLKTAEPATTALSVEMTAYALLANLWQSKTTAASSLPIVQWLLQQKSEGGGFKSTQDTVMAFTALSKFAQRTMFLNDQDQVDVVIRSKRDTIRELVICRNNSEVLHEVFLPKDLEDNEFEIFVRGTGKVYMDYSEGYHTERTPATANYYTVTGKLNEIGDADKENVFVLDLCVRANATSNGQVVLIAKLPNGFEFEKEEVEALVGIYTARRGYENVQRIEVKEKRTQVNIYFDRLDANQQCLKLQVHKYLSIVSRQKGLVRVTDYYNPIHTTTSSIDIDKVTTVCQLCLETHECDVISGCS